MTTYPFRDKCPTCEETQAQLAAAQAEVERLEKVIIQRELLHNADGELASAAYVKRYAELEAEVKQWESQYSEERDAHAETLAEVERLKAALGEIRDVDGQDFHEMLSECGRGKAMGRAHCSEIARTALESGK